MENANILPQNQPRNIAGGNLENAAAHRRPDEDSREHLVSNLFDNIERVYTPCKSFPFRSGNATVSLEVPNLFLVRSREDIPVRLEAKLTSTVVRVIRKVYLQAMIFSAICL